MLCHRFLLDQLGLKPHDHSYKQNSPFCMVKHLIHDSSGALMSTRVTFTLLTSLLLLTACGASDRGA